MCPYLNGLTIESGWVSKEGNFPWKSPFCGQQFECGILEIKLIVSHKIFSRI